MSERWAIQWMKPDDRYPHLDAVYPNIGACMVAYNQLLARQSEYVLLAFGKFKAGDFSDITCDVDDNGLYK